MPLNRVVITGLGAVSPYGCGVDCLMEGLEAGRSAVVFLGAAWRGKVGDLESLVGAPLAEPLDEKRIPRKFRRSMGPLARMAHVAASEAFAEAGVGTDLLESGRLGVCFGSTLGSVQALEEAFSSYLREGRIGGLAAGTFFQVMSNSCAANLALAFQIPGRVLAPGAACASATLAIGLGYETIRAGEQDVMLCGGSEELHPIVTGTFDQVQAASRGFNDRPGRTPRPFDRDRDGTVCGEGAGALVLESEAHARRRGAPILAEVAGFSLLNDGLHLAQPHRESIVRCLNNALDKAGFLPDLIGYVSAHGTGTVQGDAAEAQALREVLGDGTVPASSLKGHIGHTLAASGAVETIASIRMMRSGVLLPTLNLDEPGPDCGGVDWVRVAREVRVDAFLKNSFAFGGTNTVLAVKRYSG